MSFVVKLKLENRVLTFYEFRIYEYKYRRKNLGNLTFN